MYHCQQNKWYPQRCQIVKITELTAAFCNEISNLTTVIILAILLWARKFATAKIEFSSSLCLSKHDMIFPLLCVAITYISTKKKKFLGKQYSYADGCL